MFCRWLTRYHEHDEATRRSIDAMARSIADGGCRGVCRESTLDYLDDVLDMNDWLNEKNG